MGRPRKEEAGKARQALIDAFWEILASTDYAQLSIRMIASYAQVNHNTFYRYFESIEDLAQKAFIETIPINLSSSLEQTIRAEAFNPLALFVEPEFHTYTMHVRLFVMSDSPYLHQIVQNTIKTMWFEYLGINDELLTKEERVIVDFFLGGLISAMRSARVDMRFMDGELIATLFQTILNLLFQISERHRSLQEPTLPSASM